MKKLLFFPTLLLLCWCTIISTPTNQESTTEENTINGNEIIENADTWDIFDLENDDVSQNEIKNIWDESETVSAEENIVENWDNESYDANVEKSITVKTGFQYIKKFDSPRSGYTVVEWRLTTELAFDEAYFEWKEDQLQMCKESPLLWWTDRCPTVQVVVIKATNWEFPWELFLTQKKWKLENSDTIRLWCLENLENIKSNSIAQWFKWKIMSNDTKKMIIEKLDMKDPILFGITKSAYNLNWNKSTDCDVTIQKIEILN